MDTEKARDAGRVLVAELSEMLKLVRGKEAEQVRRKILDLAETYDAMQVDLERVADVLDLAGDGEILRMACVSFNKEEACDDPDECDLARTDQVRWPVPIDHIPTFRVDARKRAMDAAFDLLNHEASPDDLGHLHHVHIVQQIGEHFYRLHVGVAIHDTMPKGYTSDPVKPYQKRGKTPGVAPEREPVRIHGFGEMAHGEVYSRFPRTYRALNDTGIHYEAITPDGPRTVQWGDVFEGKPMEEGGRVHEHIIVPIRFIKNDPQQATIRVAAMAEWRKVYNDRFVWPMRRTFGKVWPLWMAMAALTLALAARMTLSALTLADVLRRVADHIGP